MEQHEQAPPEEPRGVLEHREEGGMQIVRVRWADGEESTVTFPTAGFRVVARGKDVGVDQFVRQADALDILETHAGTVSRKDFSWVDYV